MLIGKISRDSIYLYISQHTFQIMPAVVLVMPISPVFYSLTLYQHREQIAAELCAGPESRPDITCRVIYEENPFRVGPG